MSTTQARPLPSRALLTGGVLAVLGLAACTSTALPASTSTASLQADAGVTLHLSATQVSVDGTAVASLDATTPDRLDDLTEVLGQHLVRRRLEHAQQGDGPPRRITVHATPDADAQILATAVVVAGAAGLDKPWLAVRGPSGLAGIPLTVPRARTRTALASKDAPEPEPDGPSTGYANPVVRLDPTRGYRIEVRDDVYDPGGAGLTLPCAQEGCTSWPTVELNRLSRRLRLDHPTDRAVVVIPGRGTVAQEVVHTLDATRDDALTARGDRVLLSQALLLVDPPRGEAP